MTITAHILTPDTQAILLLCGSLGQRRETDLRPLSPTEYHQLAQWLHIHQLRPSDLIGSEGLQLFHEREPVQFDVERIEKLLARGAALALAVETWTNRGLWVISRSDPQYPQRLRTRLGKTAPPILYGTGNQDRLDIGGLAIVGSREIDDGAVAFTRDIAVRCANETVQIVSGGARGVDSEAMLSALDAGGTAIGVLAESLFKVAVVGKYRSALREGRLALVTAYDPDAGFSVGNAMGRNKQIYALSDYALVVSSSLEQGGTWSGAIENLSHKWVPLFVRATEPMLPGNRRLLEKGGIGIDHASVSKVPLLNEWMREQSDDANEVQEAIALGERNVLREQNNQRGYEITSAADHATERRDLFPIIWPYLERELHTARTDRELADLFGLELIQVRAWLQRAIEAGMVKKLTKPMRYIAVTRVAQAETLPLFSRLI